MNGHHSDTAHEDMTKTALNHFIIYYYQLSDLTVSILNAKTLLNKNIKYTK